MRIIFFLLIFAFLGSCSDEEDTGLTASVSPDFGFLIPSSTNSCVDRQAIASATGGILIEGNSVPPLRGQLNNFILSWEPKDEEGEPDPTRLLTVVLIKLTITNANISGGEYTTSFDGEELEVLLGRAGGLVGAGPTTIQSNVAGKTINGQLVVPCGLNFGGISVNDEDRQFSAKIRIEVTAVSDLADGSDPKPVRSVATATLRNI